MQLRTILINLALLAFLSTSAGGYFYYNSLKESAFREAYWQAAAYTQMAENTLSSSFRENASLVRVLSGLREIQDILENPNAESLQAASAVLDYFHLHDAAVDKVCYVMDGKGTTVASSNHTEPDSFVGHNYSFRCYFRDALRGISSIHTGLGVTSGRPGVYFSHPVYGADRKAPLGVVVIKSSVEYIEESFSQVHEGTVVVTDSRGTVFISTRQDWLYHPLWKLLPEEAPVSLAVMEQIGAAPQQWTGLEKVHDGNGRAVDRSGNEYMVQEQEIDGAPGWHVVYLTNMEDVSRRVTDPLIQTTGRMVILLSVLVGVAVLFLYRGATLDIARRRKAEEALRRSEVLYRAIVEDQTELISRFSPGGTLTFVNAAYCRFFGEAPQDLLQNKFWHHVPEEHQQRLKEYIRKLNTQRTVDVIEHPVITAGGETRWLQWTDRPIFDDRGRMVEIQAVGRDITERKRAEQALRESEKQLRFLSAQLLKAQEEERKRISRELHDSIGSSLSAVKFTLENTVNEMRQGKATPESLEQLIKITQHSIEESRRIMTDLRPSILDDLGIVATLGWFCRHFEKIYPSIRIDKKIDVEEDAVPESVKIVIFRIVQEACNNTAKYSQADTIWLALTRFEDIIELSIRDNGVGFDIGSVFSRDCLSKGFGLTSMRERAELSGGALSIDSSPGKGTSISATWISEKPSDEVAEK